MEGASDNTTNNSTSTAAATVEESVDSIDGEGENNEHLNDLNYNPRIVPCPGYESSNLQGYITLEALIQDMRDYYQATNRIGNSSSSSENNGTSIINIFIWWPRPAVLLFVDVDVDVEFVKIILLFEDGINASDSDESGGRRNRKKPSSSPLPPSLFFTLAMEEEEDHTININLLTVSRGRGEEELQLNCPWHQPAIFVVISVCPGRATPPGDKQCHSLRYR